MATDFFASSPLDDPLSYPGLIPSFSYVLTGPRSLVSFSSGHESLLEGRQPVVAVGSNAAPGQLARKFSTIRSVVPVARAVASGLRMLPSAHINRHGYVPSAPCFQAGVSASVFVTFLDDTQLLRLDETEPNYRRIPFGSVVRSDGTRIEGCDIYQSRQGVITDPRALESGLLPSQPTLLAKLISVLPEVRATGVSSALDLAEAVRSGRLDSLWVTAHIQRVLRVG